MTKGCTLVQEGCIFKMHLCLIGRIDTPANDEKEWGHDQVVHARALLFLLPVKVTRSHRLLLHLLTGDRKLMP